MHKKTVTSSLPLALLWNTLSSRVNFISPVRKVSLAGAR
jgi:hypothetical protein